MMGIIVIVVKFSGEYNKEVEVSGSKYSFKYIFSYYWNS